MRASSFGYFNAPVSFLYDDCISVSPTRNAVPSCMYALSSFIPSYNSGCSDGDNNAAAMRDTPITCSGIPIMSLLVMRLLVGNDAMSLPAGVLQYMCGNSPVSFSVCTYPRLIVVASGLHMVLLILNPTALAISHAFAVLTCCK